MVLRAVLSGQFPDMLLFFPLFVHSYPDHQDPWPTSLVAFDCLHGSSWNVFCLVYRWTVGGLEGTALP